MFFLNVCNNVFTVTMEFWGVNKVLYAEIISKKIQISRYDPVVL